MHREMRIFKNIAILDTTLRDGEQAPGCWFSVDDRLRLALQLETLGVDVIEAGFPIVSDDINLSVKSIAKHIKKATVCCLCRAINKDINVAVAALKQAVNPRIHIFIATSDIHLKEKLNMSREQVLERATAAISYAVKYIPDVQFSCEDATRTDRCFLAEVCSAAIDAGATVLNIADTVGYSTPGEITELINYLNTYVAGIETVRTSIHCHNDLGLATANSLAALAASIDQIECTINGIGERAGNAALEEIVAALNIREDYYHCNSTINLKEIMKTSLMVRKLGGLPVQPHKAIVGENAFKHEAGIHQDGLLKSKDTYELVDPDEFGIHVESFTLARQSGRKYFAKYLISLGHVLSDEQIEKAFKLFKSLADSKAKINDDDIQRIIRQTL
jgi:2-isopropylmalate synthase